MKNKNVSLIITGLGLVMMIICICSLFTVTYTIDTLIAFNLSAIVAGLGIFDYNYLNKKTKI
jgi:hypothetical protein